MSRMKCKNQEKRFVDGLNNRSFIAFVMPYVVVFDSVAEYIFFPILFRYLNSRYSTTTTRRFVSTMYWVEKKTCLIHILTSKVFFFSSYNAARSCIFNEKKKKHDKFINDQMYKSIKYTCTTLL